jgi:hypothetical protein
MVVGSSVVRAQLNRVQRSEPFHGSDRLVALLRFIVGKALNGNAASLKESVIGNAVYRREPLMIRASIRLCRSRRGVFAANCVSIAPMRDGLNRSLSACLLGDSFRSSPRTIRITANA